MRILDTPSDVDLTFAQTHPFQGVPEYTCLPRRPATPWRGGVCAEPAEASKDYGRFYTS